MRLLPYLLPGLLCLLLGCAQAPPAQAGPAPTEAPPAGLAYTQAQADPALADFLTTPETATAQSCYTLESAEPALTVTCLEGAEPGPTVYVVAGLHGNETAAWQAGQLLAQATLRAGRLCLLAPANPWGAEHQARGNQQGEDLNRLFGTAPEQAATPGQRTAAAILADIRAQAPALVLDLHEAGQGSGGQDGLAQSVVGELSLAPDLIWELLTQSQAGALCSTPFALYDSPPTGSLNHALTALGIPAMTVETDRTAPLDTRVADHLAIADLALRVYGLR